MRYSDELLQGYPWNILGYPEILKVVPTVQGDEFADKTAQLVYFLKTSSAARSNWQPNGRLGRSSSTESQVTFKMQDASLSDPGRAVAQALAQ